MATVAINSTEPPVASAASFVDRPTVLHSPRSLKDALLEEKKTFISRNPVSESQHQNALKFMPGGNTRSVLHTDPFPICLERGFGNRLRDCDSHEYIDLTAEYTAGLYGHAHPRIRQTIQSTFDEVGISLGGTTVQESRYAELLCQRFPSMERLRFCNSGTEANLYALSIARHRTGKRKVLVFDGGYHGGVLSFGHGISPNNVDQDDWVLGKYNDVAGTKTLLENNPDISAVIVEGMQGAGGCIPASAEFLHAIQETAAKSSVVFILDEVMTSRLYPNGFAGFHGLTPDIITLGKYLGGGMAFGCFGGKAGLLASYDPRNLAGLPHSGTFNNNTLAMSCGYVGLSEIYTPEVALEINALGDYLRTEINRIGKGTKLVATGLGAVLTVHFLNQGIAPRNSEELERQSIGSLKTLFWFWCLRNGFWITQRGMMSLVLGTTKEEVELFVKNVASFCEEHADLLSI